MLLMGDFNARTGTVDDGVTSINMGIIPEADSISFDVNVCLTGPKIAHVGVHMECS